MDSMAAFAMGKANQDRELMVFDWIRAARMIHDSNATEVSAGLAGDWEWTGGQIITDGKPTPRDDTYVYLASTWARPEIEINGDRHDCFVMQSETPGWDCDTYWPPEAKAILRGEI
jgi:hypothetical protein